MKEESNLEFKCTECNHPVYFSVLNDQQLSKTITCEKCDKKYLLGTQILSQLKQFEALCKQIQQSKEIFGQSAVAIDVGPHQVKIPFQLLLTRLSSVLELNIGKEKTNIAFRVDTLKGLSLSHKPT